MDSAEKDRTTKAIEKASVQGFIVTTEDNIRLCMKHHAQRMKNTTAWIGPVSLFVTIVLVLSTADFKEALGVAGETWHSVFFLLAFVTFIWSLLAVVSAIVASTSIDNIVDELKQLAEAENGEPPNVA